MNSHLGWLTGAVVAGSAIGLLYYLRIMVSLYLPTQENLRHDTPSNWAMTAGRIVVLISSLLVLLLGLYPQPLITLVQLAQYINVAPRMTVCRKTPGVGALITAADFLAWLEAHGADAPAPFHR